MTKSKVNALVRPLCAPLNHHDPFISLYNHLQADYFKPRPVSLLQTVSVALIGGGTPPSPFDMEQDSDQ